MKLLDFTGRKVDPSLMMGFKENKKDEDPSIKVLIFSLSHILSVCLKIKTILGLSSLQALCFCGTSHS